MSIFIPKKVKVGFQTRKDTYTKKLAYVIYYDEKGKLRKETSWEGWRDEKIDPEEYSNDPTSGFVLNKKVGDYKSDWNHRMAYCRVYDPRGFEFEITIENLLYILQNTSCIKGKGLDGDFVYSWDGKDLVLLPCSAPEYGAISQFTEELHSLESVKTKDLILGATYLTKKQEKVIYLGKFNYYETSYNYSTDNREKVTIFKGKRHYFKEGKRLESKTGLNHLLKVIDKEPVSNYAYLVDALEYCEDINPIKYHQFEPTTLQDESNKSTRVFFTYKTVDFRADVSHKDYYGNYVIKKVYEINRSDCYNYWYKSTLEKELDNLFKDVKTFEDLKKIEKEFGFTVKQEYLTNGKAKQERSNYNFFEGEDRREKEAAGSIS